MIAFDLDGGVGDGGLSFGGKRWRHSIESGLVQGLAVADCALFVACQAHEDGDASLFCLDRA